MYGNGDGTLQNPVQYTLANSAITAVAADFNGDGETDLALPNTLTSNNLTTYLATGGDLGAGTHTFTAWETDLAGNVSASAVVDNYHRDDAANRQPGRCDPHPGIVFTLHIHRYVHRH